MTRRRFWLAAGVTLVAVVAGAVLFWRETPPVPTATTAGSSESPIASREDLIRYVLFDALRPVKLSNCELERFGQPHDGGYLMCGNLFTAVEAGYSYGVSYYDQWGCDIARRLKTRVHQYDCLQTRQPTCPGGDTLFHAECLSPGTGVEDGRVLDTISSHIGKNRDEAKHLVVKIDVEGAEWDSLRLAPDAVLDQIDQLVVQFHGVQDEQSISVVQRLKEFFYIAHVHFSNFVCDSSAKPFPARAFEVLLVSRRLGVPEPSGETASSPHPLDAPSNAAAADCPPAIWPSAGGST